RRAAHSAARSGRAGISSDRSARWERGLSGRRYASALLPVPPAAEADNEAGLAVLPPAASPVLSGPGGVGRATAAEDEQGEGGEEEHAAEVHQPRPGDGDDLTEEERTQDQHERQQHQLRDRDAGQRPRKSLLAGGDAVRRVAQHAPAGTLAA